MSDCPSCAETLATKRAADKDAAAWRTKAIVAMRRHCEAMSTANLRKNTKGEMVPCRSMLEVATLLYPYLATTLYPEE